ncbi:MULTISPECIES: DinB family protein [Micromonospora]|nr:DinB family protein [Micromonospora yangpuensis]
MLARTGDERAVLEAFLDLHRGVLLRKLEGLTDAEATRRLVPSDTTVAGLVKHLTMVERNWLPRLFEPAPDDPRGDSAEAGRESFTVREGETVDRLAEAYRQACARSREVSAAYDLDHVVTHPLIGEISLRWVLVHLIEETARHVGHADILREQTDGATGAV